MKNLVQILLLSFIICNEGITNWQLIALNHQLQSSSDRMDIVEHDLAKRIDRSAKIITEALHRIIPLSETVPNHTRES